MVRILKVKELEEQKRALVARSEMYRQTLKLQVADIKTSAGLLKRRFGFLRTSSRVLGFAAPLLGMFLFRRAPVVQKPRSGLLPKMLLGLKLFRQVWPVLRNLRPRKRDESRRKSFSFFS